MAVAMRLTRVGARKDPVWRVVVADSRSPRDGRSIEEIGIYHPTTDPSTIEVNSERVLYWLGVGAQPSEQVAALLKITGDWQKFKGLPGTEGTYRKPVPRARPVAPGTAAKAPVEAPAPAAAPAAARSSTFTATAAWVRTATSARATSATPTGSGARGSPRRTWLRCASSTARRGASSCRRGCCACSSTASTQV